MNNFRLTGFVAMRMGTTAGIITGGGSMSIHYAQQKGYISLDWEKINKKLDKISDKIEKEATGSTPAWTDKVSIQIFILLLKCEIFD